MAIRKSPSEVDNTECPMHFGLFKPGVGSKQSDATKRTIATNPLTKILRDRRFALTPKYETSQCNEEKDGDSKIAIQSMILN